MILCVNYCRRSGLTKNRKVIIKDITYYRIGIIIADDINKSNCQLIWIPKLRFRFRINHGKSFAILRTQFPLRRAYSFTFDKSQGQTLNKVILDLRHPIFSHGQLYVGCSRVQLYKNIKFYIDEKHI